MIIKTRIKIHWTTIKKKTWSQKKNMIILDKSVIIFIIIIFIQKMETNEKEL